MIIPLNKNIIEALTKTELEIVNFINDNAAKLPELSIVDIAFDTYTSPATVSRAIRKCGINGFQELRYLSSQTLNDKDINNINEIIHKSLIEAQRVIEQISLVDILNIVSEMKKGDCIYIFSMGLTEFVAREFSLKLQLLNYNTFEIHDGNIMQKKAKELGKQDVVIVFSLNGRTEEIIESARSASMRGAIVTCCCCNKDSPILQFSKYYVIGYKHAHEPIENYEVSSRIPLYMISRIIIDYISY